MDIFAVLRSTTKCWIGLALQRLFRGATPLISHRVSPGAGLTNEKQILSFVVLPK